MPLSDFSQPQVEIVEGDIRFTVGPLTLAQFGQLRDLYAAKMFDTITAFQGMLLCEDINQRSWGVVGVISQLSDAVAHLIALAAGEETQIDAATKLPMKVQLIALYEIGKLTLGENDLNGAGGALLSALATAGQLRPEELN